MTTTDAGPASAPLDGPPTTTHVEVDGQAIDENDAPEALRWTVQETPPSVLTMIVPVVSGRPLGWDPTAKHEVMAGHATATRGPMPEGAVRTVHVAGPDGRVEGLVPEVVVERAVTPVEAVEAVEAVETVEEVEEVPDVEVVEPCPLEVVAPWAVEVVLDPVAAPVLPDEPARAGEEVPAQAARAPPAASTRASVDAVRVSPRQRPRGLFEARTSLGPGSTSVGTGIGLQSHGRIDHQPREAAGHGRGRRNELVEMIAPDRPAGVHQPTIRSGVRPLRLLPGDGRSAHPALPARLPPRADTDCASTGHPPGSLAAMTRAGSGRFGAVVTAMVTPFDDEGALDPDGAAALARWLTTHGSDALVVAGSTGEGSVLDDDEAATLFRAVKEAVTVPVIAATGANDTRHTIHRSALAAGAGVDALLVVTPYYNRPPQRGLADHFEAVAASTSLPVLLYDIPVRSGRKIEHDTMLRLARTPNIVGVKDAASDLPATTRLVAELPEHFEVYCGEDVVTLPMLAVGAVGVVSVASHWAGVEMADLVHAFAKGDVEAARLDNAALLASYDFESTPEDPNPLPAKAACRALGLPAGQCRLPLGAPSAGLDGRARALVATLSAGRAGA